MDNQVHLHTGENDIDQLCCVLRVLGTPNETIWPVRYIVIIAGNVQTMSVHELSRDIFKFLPACMCKG